MSAMKQKTILLPENKCVESKSLELRLETQSILVLYVVQQL